ncbi:MAG: response regulator [Candidatus Margulisiibacteriota bacterium]
MRQTQVLLVEETPTELSWMETVLKEENFHVLTATSAKEALETLETNPVTPLIILSATLPDASPTDLIPKIEAFLGLPHILVLSNHLTAKTAVEWMKIGAADILQRPFHDLEFRIAVKQSFDTQVAHEVLNRELERNTTFEIEERLENFKKFLAQKKESGSPILPSEITLYFPYHDPFIDMTQPEILQAMETKTHTKQLGNWPKPVILAIDDEPHMLDGIEMALITEFTVLKTTSGEDALEKITATRTSETSIDLILLDIGMPGKSGDKWVSEFKAANPNIPIVMLTAFKDTDLIVKTLRSGATDYVTKPFLNHKLVEKLSSIVQAKLMSARLLKWMGRRASLPSEATSL